MSIVLFTGYPGFLGSALLPLVLDKRPDAKALCVVQERFMPLATKRLVEQTREHPTIEDRVDLVVGTSLSLDSAWLNRSKTSPRSST